MVRPCLEWSGYRNACGYGVCRVKREGLWKTALVHRVVCEESHGPPPSPEHCALHSCDNPACREPEHLRWGTRQDNVDDCRNRGRLSRGERHVTAKLTEQQARLIKTSGLSLRRLAAQFGVGQTVIHGIKSGAKWKHI